MIVDVSYCQKGLDLSTIPQLEKVIIRLGVRDHLDTECMEFIRQCKEYNTPYAFYWYVMAENEKEWYKEYECCLRLLKQVDPECDGNDRELFFDVEEPNNISLLPLVISTVKSSSFLSHGVYSFAAALQNVDTDGVRVWVAWWGKDEITVRKKFPYACYWQTGSDVYGDYEVDTNMDICDQRHMERKTRFIRLYASSIDNIHSNTNWDLWRYDDVSTNGRFRVTCDPKRIGKKPIENNVTGWVNKEDWIVYEKRH